MAAFGFGFIIVAISSILSVAGGEVIIPTLVFGYGVPIKAAGSLSMLILLPTVLTGIVRHARGGAYAEQGLLRHLVIPMGAGCAPGAVVGGLLVSYAPSAALKLILGLLLVWSAQKVLGKHG